MPSANALSAARLRATQVPGGSDPFRAPDLVVAVRAIRISVAPRGLRNADPSHAFRLADGACAAQGLRRLVAPIAAVCNAITDPIDREALAVSAREAVTEIVAWAGLVASVRAL